MILFVIAQINLLNSLPAFGIIANCGVVLISALGIVAGGYIGSVVGFFYGFACDLIFSKTLGVYTVTYLLIGILAGYLQNRISKDNKFSMSLMVVINTLLFELLLCFFAVFVNKMEFSFLFLAKVIVVEELYNIFLTYILFRPLIFWGEIINRSRDSYYLLH